MALVFTFTAFVFCGAMAAYFASEGGRGPAGFALGLFFGPFGVVAALLLQPTIERQAANLIAVERARTRLERPGHSPGRELADSQPAAPRREQIVADYERQCGRGSAAKVLQAIDWSPSDRLFAMIEAEVFIPADARRARRATLVLTPDFLHAVPRDNRQVPQTIDLRSCDTRRVPGTALRSPRTELASDGRSVALIDENVGADFLTQLHTVLDVSL